MKRNIIYLLVVILVFAFSNSSWAQFPCYPGDSVTTCCGADSDSAGYSRDLGICDTLYVEPWPYTDTCFIGCNIMGECDTICINEPGEQFPCFWYVSLFVTHDSNTFYFEEWPGWVQDSIAAFVIPLTFWHDSEGGGKVIFPTSSQLNNSIMDPWHPLFPKSMFRHIVDENGDTVYNRLAWMAGPPNFLDPWWVGTDIDTLSSDGDSGHVFMSLVDVSERTPRWWEGSRVLLATLTFIVYPSEECDTIEIGLDSTFWPAYNLNLCFYRYDAVPYCPRHYLTVEDTLPSLFANFSAEPESGCVPLQVQFTSLSQGNPTSWLWDFGDDSTSTDQHPIHTYNDTGYFDVKLVVSNQQSADSVIKQDYIHVYLFMRGDANGDCKIDIADIVYLVNYLFIDGPAPDPLWVGDANCDDVVNIADVVYLVNYLFIGGPPPDCE